MDGQTPSCLDCVYLEWERNWDIPICYDSECDNYSHWERKEDKSQHEGQVKLDIGNR